MARRAHAYPQVDPRAAGLVDVRVVAAPAALRVADAGRLVERRRAGAIATGPRSWVVRDDLRRALSLGLADLPISALGRRLPSVGPEAREVAVRRLLTQGTPLVIVTGRGGVAQPARPPRPGAGFGTRLIARMPDEVRALVDAVERLAATRRAPAFLVGGTVRDALLGPAPARRDIDIVVEGDGLAFARALAATLPARLVEHARFLTASLTMGSMRVDVATARTERYDVPGALPRVEPARIGADLGRRDFTVNAMAVAVDGAAYDLLDPHGGRRDLARRRLRVLHPLSCVEDPTRIFRAGRYAARLDFGLDADTVAAIRLALQVGSYPALSGARLVAELRLIAEDSHPDVALLRLGRMGAFTLLGPGYRFTRRTAGWVTGLPAALRWGGVEGPSLDPLELLLVVLLADQVPSLQTAAMRRLGLDGAPRDRVARALTLGGTLPGRLATAPAREAAAVLRGASDLELTWAWLAADAVARSALTVTRERVRRARPVLGGDEVIALGVPRGPAVAQVLEELRVGRLEGRLRTRDGEIGRVRDWLRCRQPAGREG